MNNIKKSTHELGKRYRDLSKFTYVQLDLACGDCECDVECDGESSDNETVYRNCPFIHEHLCGGDDK